MEIWVAIGIFIIIAAFLFALFCLTLRYFSNRMLKWAQNPDQIYSMLDAIKGYPDHIEQTQCNQYISQRLKSNNSEINQKNAYSKNNKHNIMQYEMQEPKENKNLRKRQRQIVIDENQVILRNQDKKMRAYFEEQQNCSDKQKNQSQQYGYKYNDCYNYDNNARNLRQKLQLQLPLQPNMSSDIYGIANLKNSLNTPFSLPETPTSLRYSISPKNFQPHKLVSPYNKSPTAKQCFQREYEFQSKIISYTPEGIQIIQKIVEEIQMEQNGYINQNNTKFSKNYIVPKDEYFMDALNAYGFEEENYGIFKVFTTFFIPQMKSFERYSTNFLRKKEEKKISAFSHSQ